MCRFVKRLFVWAIAMVVLMVASPDEARSDAGEAKRLIVMIDGKFQDRQAIGAGIIVGSGADRLYIATANHVVRQGPRTRPQKLEQVRVRLKFLPGQEIEAEVLSAFDRNLDLAVLSVKGVKELAIPVDEIPFHRLGEADGLKRGDEVYTIGYPRGKRWQVNVNPDRISENIGDSLAFESQLVAKGHSGGGLFNKDWELVGMITADQPPNGVAVPIDKIIRKLKKWGFPVQLAAAAPPAKAQTDVEDEEPKAGRELADTGPGAAAVLASASYMRLEISNVDYVPPLKGAFGRNSVSLVIDTPGGVISRTRIDVGRPRLSSPIKIVEYKDLEMRIIEIGTMKTFTITDGKAIDLNELVRPDRHKFRILNKVFRDNPNLDPTRRQISFSLRALPFDPEEASGIDQQANGARMITHGTAHMDTVSFMDKDATDHVMLVGSSERCTAIVWATRPQNIWVTVTDGREERALQLIDDLGSRRVWTTPCPSRSRPIVRVNAAAPRAKTEYGIVLLQRETWESDFLNYLSAWLPQQKRSAYRRPKDKKTVGLGQGVAKLRRHFNVDHSVLLPFLEGFAESLERQEENQRTVMAILEPELPVYLRALDKCCGKLKIIPQLVAVAQAEKGEPFDSKHFDRALHSANRTLAIRAVRALGKTKDRGSARNTLKDLLLDPRDDVAKAARKVLLRSF